MNIKKLLFFCLMGIITANSIALYRDGSLSGSVGIAAYAQGLKSFFSDTAAQSYYSGITIIYYLENVGNGLVVFFKWVLSLLTGSLFVDRSTVEFSKLAEVINPNGGGGLFQSSFYAFYGYIGVALGSLLVSCIIKKVFFSWNNTFSILLRYVIPVMSFRWYLYNPTAFFRACLLNFFIMYFSTKMFYCYFEKKEE